MRGVKGDRYGMRAMFGSAARAFAVFGLVFGSTACGDVARQGRSPSLMVIEDNPPLLAAAIALDAKCEALMARALGAEAQ